MWETPPISSLREALVADPLSPIGMRMRAAYFLRHHHETAKNDKSTQREVVEILSRAAKDVRMGSLLRHELCYVMGQVRDEQCCEALESILLDETDCVMVRHEAAEALGAIGADRSELALRSIIKAHPDRPELSETCQLALNVMDWRSNGSSVDETPAACACMLSPYSSVDPAPPHPAHVPMSTKAIGDLLCNPDEPIFERYRAMFSLRNRGGEEAVQELCRALVHDTSSALLRHEVAYVLGQMQHPLSVEALEESLRRGGEHEMVRHESAEALGAIEGRWEEVEAILKEFTKDDNVVVRESCLVALDAADYWGHSESPTGVEQEEPGNEAVSFVQQKNSEMAAPSRILVNHFNVKTN